MSSVADMNWSLTGADEVATVYRALSPEVYRSLLRLTGGDTQAAEDLLADTFVTMARATRSGQITSVNAAWLHTVARRKFLDAYRRNRSEERAFARVGPRPEEAPEPDWSSIESAAGLRACRQLPPLQRAALVLRYLEDMSTAEVAAILDKSVAATESLVARARRALAELITADAAADRNSDLRSRQEGHRGS